MGSYFSFNGLELNNKRIGTILNTLLDSFEGDPHRHVPWVEKSMCGVVYDTYRTCSHQVLAALILHLDSSLACGDTMMLKRKSDGCHIEVSKDDMGWIVRYLKDVLVHVVTFNEEVSGVWK